VDDLEQTLAEATVYQPDLILVTGDIADDLTQLSDALGLIEAVGAPLGAYACLGNHEHFRGVDTVETIFAASSIPLLVNRGVDIERAGARLHLAAIDDPVRMHRVADDFFTRSLEMTLRERPSDAFTVLLSHRPDAFPYAAARRVPLTLAGHTHGGQIGFLERSILEASYPEKYLWGHYRIDASHLYTSCGAGHWFPFRLGCPQEAPIIELVRG
jgi:predicted MPP superfamily phosphohydrolase